jgi:hypothetical protein
MSVAGILGSSLFANAISQVAQKVVPSAEAGAQSVFGALQQGLAAAGVSSGSGGTSLTSQLSQIGQDLTSGNLPATQSDFSAFKSTLAQDATQFLNQSTSKSGSSAGTSSTSASGNSNPSGSSSNPLAAAMLAYSSLQQSAMNVALNASMAPLSITA